MTKYARLRVSLDASDYSDYSRARAVNYVEALTPDEWILNTVFETTGTSSTSFSVALFSQVTRLIIHNTDPTNFVTLTWAATGATSTMKIPAGAVTVITDVAAGTSNLTLVADTAAVVLSLTMIGT